LGRTPRATLDLATDLDAVRGLFPVTRQRTYLMNAAQSPLNSRSRAAIDAYLDKAATDQDARPAVREPIRAHLAGLFGGVPGDYALTTSTGAGISIVAAGFAWREGDNLVLPAGEHWSNTFPWLNLHGRGVQVRRVQPDADNRVRVADLAKSVDRRTRIISVTAVRFDTGFRADLRALADLAHAHGALLVVDGTQCAGASPIDVTGDGIDVLACAGFKWLLGLAGTGFLYVNERARALIAPVAPGMFAAGPSFTELTFHEDARKYETGTLAYALLHGWAAGLELLAELGIPAIAARNLALTDRLVAGVRTAGHRLLTPVATRGERSAIVALTTGSASGDQALLDRFAAAGVQVNLRSGSLRVSPNFFNTEAEIDRLLDRL